MWSRPASQLTRSLKYCASEKKSNSEAARTLNETHDSVAVCVTFCLWACVWCRWTASLSRCTNNTVWPTDGRPDAGYYLRLACSISMRRVWVGAPPVQCFWYRWSSPRLATACTSGSRFSSFTNLSWKQKYFHSSGSIEHGLSTGRNRLGQGIIEKS